MPVIRMRGYASAHGQAVAARRAQGKIISSLPNYDAWMPDLAPSAELVSWAVSEPFTPEAVFSIRGRYRQEMRQPTPAAHCHIARSTIITDESYGVLLL